MGCICSKGVSASKQNNTNNEENVAVSYLKYMLVSNTSIKPNNERCISCGSEFVKSALGVSELQVNKQISVMFEKKSQAGQEDILIYIYTNWHDIQQDSSVVEALKETKFVTGAVGGLYKPKDLCDPGDALLASLFSGHPHKFPEGRFVSDRWLKILRKTGLQNARDANTMLRCATRIEFLGMKHDMENQVSLEIWSLAETLIKAIFENVALLHNHNFCSVFGKIACIPAEKNFPFKNGKKCVNRVLCSYNDVVLLKDWALAWTTAPILSNKSLVPPDYSWGALQLRSPPPFAIVLKHLQANTWCAELSLYTIEEASFEVLKYLDRIWETLSSSDILELQQLAFIAADNGTRLATPGSLFACLSINLSPLASELPSRYLPFVKILQELGVEDMLSISGAMKILSNLHKSCGYNYRLNPNKLHAVIELLQFLCHETVEPADTSCWESELVVPDDGCRLVRPNTCVYIDHHGSQYVNLFDSSKLRFVHHDVSERLCLAFGIRKLSNVVVEELDYVEHLQTLDQDAASVTLTSIRLKLLSKSFQVAVSSVVNKFCNITSGSNKKPDFRTLQISLESVAKRLKFVQRIYTRFWLLPELLDITHIPEYSKSGSSHQTLYYVDRSYTCMLIAERPNCVSVVDLVAIVVSRVLGSPVPLPIGSLFLCPQDYEPVVVNILNEERVIECVSHGTGFLGTDILPRDEKKVRFSRLQKPFVKGEIVAWQIRKGEKLKYGRIVENVRLKLSGGLKIETSPGMTKTIISSHVFHFESFKTEEDSSKEGDNSMPVQQPQGYGGVNLKNQRHEIKERELGRVPDEEFVQSIEEMFSVAGINMDTEKQCLLQTTLSLHHRLNESQASLVLQQEKLKMATKEANIAKTTLEIALQCRICLAGEIDFTLVPCGHMLCRTCASNVTYCPTCGIKRCKTMKLYRP